MKKWIAIYLVFVLLMGVCPSYPIYANQESEIGHEILSLNQENDLQNINTNIQDELKQQEQSIKIATGGSISTPTVSYEKKLKQARNDSNQTIDLKFELCSEERSNLYYDDTGMIHYTPEYEGSWVLSPVNYKIKFRLTLIMEGQDRYEKEEIKLFIPKELFQKREVDDSTEEITLGIPQSGGSEGFAYRFQDDKLIIYNEVEKVGACKFVCDITYSVGVVNDQIKAASIIGDAISLVKAELEVGKEPNVIKKKSNEIRMQYHSGLSIDTIKQQEPVFYNEWNTSWGEKPSDADNYNYVEWRMDIHFQRADQPGSLSVIGTAEQGEWIGYAWVGVSENVAFDIVKPCREQVSVTRDYAANDLNGKVLQQQGLKLLVRYPKGEKEYITYKMVDMAGRVQCFDTGKTQEQSIQNNLLELDLFPKMVGGSTRVYQLDEYLNAAENKFINIDDFLSHKVRVVGKPFLIQNHNGEQNYQIELTNNLIYLGNRQLKKDEYTLSQCYIEAEEYNSIACSSRNFWGLRNDVNKNEWAEYILEYQTGTNDEWKTLGSLRWIERNNSYDLYYTKDGTQNEDIVNENTPVLLEQGTTGVRVKHNSKYYMSELSLYVNVELKATSELQEYMRQNSSGENNLYSISTLRVFDKENIWSNRLTGSGLHKNNTEFFNQDYIVPYINFQKEEIEKIDQDLYGINSYAQHEKAVYTIMNNKEWDGAEKSSINLTCTDTPVVDKKYLLQEGEIEVQSYLKTNELPSKRMGKIYILLPIGFVIKQDSIKEKERSQVEITNIEVHDNWRDSRRQMVIVSLENSENVSKFWWMTINYQGVYTEHSMLDYGEILDISYAYEEIGYDIWNGLPDTGGTKDRELMDNLSSEMNKKNSILYGNMSHKIYWNYAGVLESSTWVKNEKELLFDETCEIELGDQYTYCIRPLANNRKFSMANLMVYDVFENANMNGEDRASWKGTLESIDLHHARLLGINPVIYYATKDVIVDKGNIPNVQDNTIWTKEKPEDLSTVRAVAIDLSKKTNGEPFLLENNKGVSIYIKMKAPKLNFQEVTKEEEKYVYNGAWFSGTWVSEQQAKEISKARAVNDDISIYEMNTVKVRIRSPKISIQLSGGWGDTLSMQNPNCYTISVTNDEARDYENVVIEDIITPKIKVFKITDKSFIGWYAPSITESPNSSIKLLKDENQQYQFVIPTLESGKTVEFCIWGTVDIDSVVENEKIDNYATIKSIEGNIWNKDSNIVSKTVVFSRQNISVQKLWEDDDNKYGKRPTEVTVRLMENRKDKGKKMILSEANHWRGSLKALLMYCVYDEEQNTIRMAYDIQEDEVLDYVSELEPGGRYEKDPDTKEWFFVYYLRNSYYTGTRRDILVEKVWKNDESENRPVQVIIKLLANGKDTKKELILSEANNWKGKFEQVPEEKNEQAIEYSIEEVAVPNYKSDITGDMINGFTVTNTYNKEEPKPETRTIPVFIQWKNEDNSVSRPQAVTVKLTKDGKEVSVTDLSQTNEWTGQLQEVTKYDMAGKEIVYTTDDIQVIGVPSNYTTVVTGDMVAGFTVTNTYKKQVPPVIEEEKPEIVPSVPENKGQGNQEEEIPEEIPTRTIAVTKEWKDENNKEKQRPNKVTIKLLKNGKVTGETVSLSETTGWKGSFVELPKYETGQEIEYSIEEVEVSGYQSEVTGSIANGFVVTNTYTGTPKLEKRSISVTKVWKDENNKEKQRPNKVTIKLLADGKATGKTLVLSEANGWTGNFEDVLKQDSSGVEIEYTVEEISVSGYQSKVTGNMTRGFIVTNTYETMATVPTEEGKTSTPSVPTKPDTSTTKKNKPNLDLELNKKEEQKVQDPTKMTREVMKNIELFLKGHKGEKLGEMELLWLKQNGVNIQDPTRMSREVLKHIEFLLKGMREKELEPMNLQLQQGLQGSSQEKVVKTYDEMKIGVYSICFVSAGAFLISSMWKRRQRKNSK